MAITYQTPGATAYSAAGGASVAPTYPASIAAGDLLIMIVGLKPSVANSGVVGTPSGWSNIGVGQVTGGGYGATLGADTGNTTIAAFSKTAAGGESGTVSVSLTSNNVTWAKIFRLSGSGVWSVAAAFADDSSAGNVSLAFPANPGVTANDFILAGMCIPTDVTTPSQFSAEALSQASVTFGTVTEIEEPDSTTGNDIGGFLVRAPVNSGTATGNPTLTATAGGTTTNVRGPGVFVRIRELPAATMAPTEAADTAAANVTLGRFATMAPSEAADAINVGTQSTLNPSDKAVDLTLSGGNLTATRGAGTGHANVRSTTSKASGLVYAEVTADTVNATTFEHGIVGLLAAEGGLTTYLGNQTPFSFGYFADGNEYHDGGFNLISGGTVSSAEVLGVAIDFDTGKAWVRDAGGYAGGGDPAAGTSPTYSFTPGTSFYLAVGTYGSGDQVTINFGGSAFAYTVPSGYSAWDAASGVWDVDVTPPIGTIPATLAAIEGTDTVAASAQRGHPATLASTEGSDSAALNTQRGHPLALNGTEGGDTAAMSAKRGHPAILTVTEGSDVAAASVTNGTAKVVTLTVIEGSDTSAVSVGVSGAPASGSDYLQRRRRRRA